MNVSRGAILTGADCSACPHFKKYGKTFYLGTVCEGNGHPGYGGQVLMKVANSIKIEWSFTVEQKQVYKISTARTTLKELHDELHATALYKEIKLFEHVEW
jgi:hypothetical protein